MTMTLPLIHGVLVAPSEWKTLIARAGWRIYPYSLGAMVRSAASASTSIDTEGLGEIAVNDYVMVCTSTAYGNSTLFIPDTAKIAKVTAVSGSDSTAQITVDTALTVSKGDWLFNLETDTGGSSPNYDGSDVTIYDDPVGTNTHSTKYVLTGSGGTYRAWLTSGLAAVDLLVTDGSGAPQIALPLVATGPEVV